jgi:hypothetical protein
MSRKGFLLLVAIAAPITVNSQSIPKPESVLGFPVGTDFKLADYDQSVRYFRELAKASNRIRAKRRRGTSGFSRQFRLPRTLTGSISTRPSPTGWRTRKD